MALTMAIAATPISAFAAEDELTQDEVVDIVDDFVEVGEEGVLEVELPLELVNEIGQETYEALLAGIEAINELIEDGTLEVTENGTIYESDNDELIIQGGGVNDYEIYWWGLRRWANQQAAKQIAYNLGHESSMMVSLTIPGLVTLLGGSGGTAAAFCGALGIAACVGSAYLADIERDINYYNNPRGVVIDLYWCLYCSVYSQ